MAARPSSTKATRLKSSSRGGSLDQDATWHTPDGAGSDLTGRDLHPVVHVTLNDARAYADWAGGRHADRG